MANLTPYRALPVERRVALVTHELTTSKDARNGYIQRLVARGGGFRPVTLRTWPIDRLAKEIVRRALETLPDEIGMLQALYVDLEPEIQIAFLDAAGVPHEGATIPEKLEPPFADAAAVAKAADQLIERFGDAGRHYLWTIAIFNGEAWPGLSARLPEFVTAK